MKTKITQTLLNNWLRIYENENGYEEFLHTLNREPMQATQAMLDGVRFENVVNAVLDGEEIDPDHEWYGAIKQLHPLLEGSQKQVNIYKNVTIDGEEYVLNGVLDFLKAGIIYDTKFSKKYHLNKYFKSPQHPMYFALVPEAFEFNYLSSDGQFIYKETYHPDEVIPIEITIAQFRRFIRKYDLEDTYKKYWNI